MTNIKFEPILTSITNKINNGELINYVNLILKSWFIKLNLEDIRLLTILGSFLAFKINKLFIEKDINDKLFYKQYSLNNNRDLKAIILLLLPYINDEIINVYDKMTDLNELLLTNRFSKDILKQDRNDVLKTHFKYTNMGIGLFDVDNNIDLLDAEYGKLIYKIIYHNFISIIDTLSIVNGKLYVNWLNIIPLNLTNYKESTIYKNTNVNLDNAIQNLSNDNFIDLLDYNGLYIGEYYNVFRNIFYENIKNVKWLIFINNNSETNKYIIQYLDDKFNFDNFFNINSYDDLDLINKDQFKINLLNTKENEYSIWKNIILFFANNYTYRNIIVKEILNPFIIKIDVDDRDSDFNRRAVNKINEITNINIKYFIDSIDPKDIWNYIKESLTIFETTIYSKYLINNKKITDFTYFKNGDTETKLNLKNLYNIAKSLSHYSSDNWTLLPIKYSSLELEEQKNFWLKFNLSQKNSEWINLRGNLNLEENRILNNFEYNNKLDEILGGFKIIKYQLVWEYLVINGLLSEFKINTLDLNFKKEITKEVGKIADNEDYKNSYYYVTNKQYKDHKFRIPDKKLPNAIETSYLKNIKTQLWYSFYAMNWIVQINFFKHYLNHRVLYVTGATGQGKSTQVPKLFMYALKMLDYKNDGKVICTQPRIGPTYGNATRISDELGVPILQYSNTLKETIKSDNYYVQYGHSEDKHILNKPKHISLKLLTDGTLLTELRQNPLLKEEINVGKKKEETMYTNINKYDIIIIDEAHEHNTNMDLILTLARQSCYMNNSLKLIIMSATMDDDEPNFRTYYHCINDNLVYPLRSPSFNYFNSIEQYILYDSIYLDRRFHIAPPGQSTQYTIKEIYDANGNTNDIVLQILSSSVEGDILIFENGTSDIYKRVEILNQITPKNVIALPYLGTGLNSKYKEVITDLQQLLPKVRIAKNLVHLLWNDVYTVSNDVSASTYTRCIIIATNVAEASLTIETLKYVIDNGFAKVNKYNDVTETTELIVEMISEASRKQRKGRVGRVASGTIYYLYNKGDREHIKSKYKINQEDFGVQLLPLLEMRTLENETQNNIVLKNYDPNNPKAFINNIDNIDNIKETVYYKKNIYKIQKEQFNTNIYLNYWDDKYFDFKPVNYCMIRNMSGYNINIALDKLGLFYIIHPYENRIKRNILGVIIEYLDTDNKWIKIKLELPDYYFTNLILNKSRKYFLVDIKALYSQLSVNKIIKNDIYKTELFELVNKLREIIEINEILENDLIMILTSIAYNTFEENLEILTMIKTINNSIKNLILDMKKYNNQDNEIEFIYNIINDFKNKFHFLNLFNIKNINTTNLKEKYKNNVDTIIEQFIKDRNKSIYDPPVNIYTSKQWNKFNELYNKGELKINFDYIITDILKTSSNFYNFEDYKDEIIKWCKYNNINGDIFIEFLKKLVTFKLSFATRKKNNNPNLITIDPLEEMANEASGFKKSLITDTKIERIIRPFIHGEPFNIAIKCSSNVDYYKTTQSLTIIYNNNKINNKANLLYYYNKTPSNQFDYDMTLTNKIKIEWLFNVLPFYYKPSNFKNIILKRNDTKIDKLINQGDMFDYFCVELRNKWTLNNIPYESTNMLILRTFIKNLKKNTLIYE